MARIRKSYDDEIVNIRAFYLKLLQKIWIIPLALVAGAVLGGLIYYLTNVVYGPARKYESTSTLYIDFAYDENKGTEVDYYNAFTWNILLATDDIADLVVLGLQDAGYTDADISREEAIACLNADIPSDVRVMLLSAENTDPALCKALMDAANKALVAYGQSNKAFEQIKILGVKDVKVQVKADRLKTAAILGGVVAFVLVILGLLMLEAMDDAVYIPEDVEKRYRLQVLGVMTAKGKEEPTFCRNEILSVFKSYAAEPKKVAVFSVDDKETDQAAKEGVERLSEILGSMAEKKNIEFVPLTIPGSDQKTSETLEAIDGAILMVAHGKRNGAMTEHMISILKKLGCPVDGIVITNADDRFLKRYLGL